MSQKVLGPKRSLHMHKPNDNAANKYGNNNIKREKWPNNCHIIIIELIRQRSIYRQNDRNEKIRKRTDTKKAVKTAIDRFVKSARPPIALLLSRRTPCAEPVVTLSTQT